MIEIAIIEDTDIHARTLQAYLQRFADENQAAFYTTVFHNAVAFLENYSAKYDVVFMDIAMPYLNGMDAAHALRKLDKDVLLIFITSLAQYAVQGYDVDAFAYLAVSYTQPEPTRQAEISDAVFCLKKKKKKVPGLAAAVHGGDEWPVALLSALATP